MLLRNDILSAFDEGNEKEAIFIENFPSFLRRKRIILKTIPEIKFTLIGRFLSRKKSIIQLVHA